MSCRKMGITISKKKLQFGQSVKFAGHIVSAGSIKPDPDRLAAIRQFPRPQDVSQLRKFPGSRKSAKRVHARFVANDARNA